MGFNVNEDRASLRGLRTTMEQFGDIHACLPVFTARSTMLVIEYEDQTSYDNAVIAFRTNPPQIRNKPVVVCQREDFLNDEFCTAKPKEIIISGFPHSWDDHEFVFFRSHVSLKYGVISSYRVQRLRLGASIVRVVLKDNTSREALFANASFQYNNIDLYVYSEDLVEPS